ncbi:hypothetical protein NW757_003101 [Fusarium falciforme]|nr:hypothetical protein NW757_003101 [Fusarium falciforme]
MDKGGKGGHFSTVCRAKIHADHYPDCSKSNKTINGEIQVALKELKYLNESRYDVGGAWASEVKALDQINQLQLKHLIRRTGAFKKGEDYYIMFEWADGGNLRDLWQRTDVDCAELNGDRIMKVLEQLLGLAEALSKLHNKANHNKNPTGTPERLARAETLLASPADNVPKIQIQADNESNGDTRKTGEEHWRHGDLKPDNILLFKDAASPWLGTLKIADLGLAKQHEFATSQRVDPTRQVYSTSQYEAPEVVTKPLDPRSRLYDIWSMGCIILEFVIWLLYGHAGLRNFYNEKPKALASRDTLYFTLKHQGRLAEVSDIVKRWMEHMLQFDPECSGESPSVLRDLIRLVKDHLLVVDLPGEGLVSKNCRGDADFLENSLRSIMLRAKVDAGGSYLFTQSSRKAVQTPKEMSSLSTGPVGKAVASKSPNLVIVPSPGPRR